MLCIWYKRYLLHSVDDIKKTHIMCKGTEIEWDSKTFATFLIGVKQFSQFFLMWIPLAPFMTQFIVRLMRYFPSRFQSVHQNIIEMPLYGHRIAQQCHDI